MPRPSLRAAVFEPNPGERKRLVEGLGRVKGVTVSRALSPEELRNESWVVLGPTLSRPAKWAQNVRQAKEGTRVMVAQKVPRAASFADAVLPLPISPKDLAARLPELMREVEAASPAGLASATALIDPVTGFYVFHHFKELLFVEVKRARRYGLPLSVGLIGVDAAVWEEAKSLRERLMAGLALTIRRSLRDTDYAVQFSEDRILLVMTHTELAGALVVCERIRDRIARAILEVGKQVLHPTVSVGLASPEPGKELSFAELTRRAQTCVSVAMEMGGNRVEFFDTVAPPGFKLPEP